MKDCVERGGSTWDRDSAPATPSVDEGRYHQEGKGEGRGEGRGESERESNAIC